MSKGSQRYATKHAFVNAAAGATTEVIAAAAGRKYVITSVLVNCGAAGIATATFKSASDAIGPLFSCAANGGVVLPHNENGWFETDENEALNITVATTVCGVLVNYVEEQI